MNKEKERDRDKKTLQPNQSIESPRRNINDRILGHISKMKEPKKECKRGKVKMKQGLCNFGISRKEDFEENCTPYEELTKGKEKARMKKSSSMLRRPEKESAETDFNEL